jgi:hypothetical protein
MRGAPDVWLDATSAHTDDCQRCEEHAALQRVGRVPAIILSPCIAQGAAESEQHDALPHTRQVAKRKGVPSAPRRDVSLNNKTQLAPCPNA